MDEKKDMEGSMLAHWFDICIVSRGLGFKSLQRKKLPRFFGSQSACLSCDSGLTQKASNSFWWYRNTRGCYTWCLYLYSDSINKRALLKKKEGICTEERKMVQKYWALNNKKVIGYKQHIISNVLLLVKIGEHGTIACSHKLSERL